jgi:carbonic anhydrase/acetyltransferase-like protein (isoleucine patch superfamily)
MNIDPTVFIAPNSTLIGNINIGADSSVWFGTVLRADRDKINIGRGTNIQDLSLLHVDPGCPINIGDEVIIGHRCIIHGCTIRNNTLVGMGAIIMNNASIGSFCIIGAGAVVTEGMVIPDYSMVMGLPAKIIKPVTESQIEKIKRNASSYIELAKEYKNASQYIDSK